jgi:hypothetical protein
MPAVFCVRLGLLEEAKIVIGIPMLTSSSSVHFWLTLCSAQHIDGASKLVGSFKDAEQLGRDALRLHCLGQASAMISKVSPVMYICQSVDQEV